MGYFIIMTEAAMRYPTYMTTIPESRTEELIRQCQQEAEKSIQEGNPPFGCVITDLEGNALIAAHNTQNTDHDPTAHAEILALRGLGQKLGTRYLDNYALFANADSCSMCMSASIKAHITTFYFGAPSEARMNPWLTVNDVAAKAATPLEIRSSILARECIAQIARGRQQQSHDTPRTTLRC